MIINIDTTPVFWANKQAYDSKQYRVISDQGSTRSSKTVSISQLLIDIASNKAYGKKEISIVSPSMPHLKKGAMKDALNILEQLQIFNENDYNRTDQIYHFSATGSYIEFFGVEDAKRVRGPGRDILFINEANLISHATYLQLALRTRETIFIDFNPADEYSWVYEVSDDPKNKLIISTYRNNLANLSQAQIDDIESLKKADENLWRVYGLGLRGSSAANIYTHYKVIDEFPKFEDYWYGLDFGYTKPASLVKCALKDNCIYWEELIYEPGLLNTDLIAKMIHLVDRNKPIFADSAEPKSIEEIYRAGFNIHPADKDVADGIKYIKSKPLFIHANSVNLRKEARSYKWKEDKNGKIIEGEVVKENDHALDAGRYGSYTNHLRGITGKLIWTIGG